MLTFRKYLSGIPDIIIHRMFESESWKRNFLLCKKFSTFFSLYPYHSYSGLKIMRPSHGVPFKMTPSPVHFGLCPIFTKIKCPYACFWSILTQTLGVSKEKQAPPPQPSSPINFCIDREQYAFFSNVFHMF